MNWAPYTIPTGKWQKNGKYKLKASSNFKWFSVPMRTIFVHRQGEYQQIEYTTFNPGSRSHIILWLKNDYGFNFPYYTKGGTPKVDVDNLYNLEMEEGKKLKRYLKVVKDLGQLSQGDNALLKLADPITSRLYGRVDTLGTNTGRMSHSKPNITQIPKAKEFRQLMTVPDGKVLIDVDADQLELVMMGQDRKSVV